jgi:predicted  nucleic acid-binding Zn-ribbon protein
MIVRIVATCCVAALVAAFGCGSSERKALSDMSARVSLLESANAALSEKLQSARSEAEELRSDLDQLRSEHEDLESDVEDLRRQLVLLTWR